MKWEWGTRVGAFLLLLSAIFILIGAGEADARERESAPSPMRDGAQVIIVFQD